MVYAPTRHRGIVQDTIDVCHFRSYLAEPTGDTRLPASGQLHVEKRPGDNVAVVTVVQAGEDLTARLDAERSRLFDEGFDALYVDLPLDRPESAHVSESLEELKLTYSGIFLNHQAAGDVLRLQSLRNATALSHDVVVASPHGAALLEYVLADMAAAGQSVVQAHDEPPVVAREGVPLVTVP